MKRFLSGVLGCAAGIMFAASATAAETMTAGVVVNKELQMQTLPRPAPAAGEVSIRVVAAAVNPADWKSAARGAGPAGGAPHIPGWDVAGVIDAIGAGVSGWAPGDPVIAFFERFGGYAEYVVAPVRLIARKPQAMSYEEASGIPLVAITAWKALVDAAQLSAGQRVLIHGGAGGVGSTAVQLAHARGAYVIATGSARNHEFLRELGADEVIDYNAVRFEDRPRDLDVVLNTVDRDTGNRSMGIVKPGGVLVSVTGPEDAERCKAMAIRCMISDRSTGMPLGEILAEFSRMADAGQYRIHVDQVFAFADAAQAWELNRQGHTRGKLILKLAEP